MKTCKVYLNSESNEKDNKKGLFVIGEIIEESYRMAKYRGGARGKDGSPRQDLIRRPIYTVRPVQFNPLIKIKKYIEIQNVEFTELLTPEFIQEINYPIILDRVM